METIKRSLSLLAPYRKAMIPVIVAGALALLAKVGVAPDMTVADALTLVVTSALVWLIPNRRN